ncbi:hypothetical protein ACP6PL_26450 [Dapis sp. BLCC M126]
MTNQTKISSTTQKSNLSQKQKFHLPLFFPRQISATFPKNSTASNNL